MRAVVSVAVGVLRDKQKRVLIALRPSHKHQGDLWEFPGGKIEAGESVESALRRELLEELGITIQRSTPLISVPFSYSDKDVLLEVREVTAFEGEPHGKEGQLVRWVERRELPAYRFPAANVPIVKAINLPEFIGITGPYTCLSDFSFRTKRATSRGAGMIVLRPADANSISELVHIAADLCHEASVPLVLSSAVDRRLWQCGDGVHLRADHLTAFRERPVENTKWFGASCHDLRQAEQACALGVDYLFLSPVLPTNSHLGLASLGWDVFKVMASQVNVPVFALGGMLAAHLDQARLVGASGVAGISAFWE